MSHTAAAAVDMGSVRRDVQALASMTRRSAGAGERASAEWVARRMESAGAREVQLLGFRYQGSYAGVHAAHFAAGLLAAAAGGRLGAGVSAAALASYELEFSGRLQWLRSLFPAGRGTTVFGRVPARSERRRTLVLVAHHDAARTGAYWRSSLFQSDRHAAERRGGLRSYATVPSLGLAVAGLGGLVGSRVLRAAGAATLATSVAVMADMARGETVPGASDNASGVAGVLWLVERFAARPLEGTDVLAVIPGCEESGMGGMAAWLAAGGGLLDGSSTLVLGLDTLGSGEPAVVSGEGGLRTETYRERELALADRGAAAAGEKAPRRWRIGGWTDPILALFAGLPALSLISKAEGGFLNYHLPTDTPDRVVWRSVERCILVAAGVAEVWAGELDRREGRPEAPR